MSMITNNESPARDRWSAEKYNEVASFVYSKDFTAPVLDLLNAQPSERIIDFGCGSGEITLRLKDLVGRSGVVVGVDSSANMVEKARQNGVTVSFVADVQDLHLPPLGTNIGVAPSVLPTTFDYVFDAVFSNAALHWCKRSPRGVVDSAARALRKGGRFVAEMGGFTNCAGVRIAIHTVLRKRGYDPVLLDPWYFPSIRDYQQILENAGFRVLNITLNPRLTPLKGDLVDWQQTFCRNSCYAILDDAEAASVMNEVQEMCEVDCRDESGDWTLMYTRLRFYAVLEA